MKTHSPSRYMVYVPLEHSEDDVIIHLLDMIQSHKPTERSIHSRITNSTPKQNHSDEFFLKKIEERIEYLDKKKIEPCQQ